MKINLRRELIASSSSTVIKKFVSSRRNPGSVNKSTWRKTEFVLITGNFQIWTDIWEEPEQILTQRRGSHIFDRHCFLLKCGKVKRFHYQAISSIFLHHKRLQTRQKYHIWLIIREILNNTKWTLQIIINLNRRKYSPSFKIRCCKNHGQHDSLWSGVWVVHDIKFISAVF